MLRNAILGLFVALLCFQLQSISVSADNEKVISCTTDGDSIYLYLKGVSDITGGMVQIGNKACEDVSIAGVDVFTPPLRTVILIDNSYSIKENKRADIQNILIQLVDQSIQGEEYRVGVFSDTITWLSDYSSDYESIKSIFNTLQYENQDTYFSDCLYNIIEEMRDSADITYSRIIMISDGADDNSIGYTNYEVNILVEKNNIPIYMLGTPGDNKALETMFSFARASKADYYLLDNAISNEEIVEGLLSDHELVCMRIIPDVSLLDGSSKNIQVTLNTAEGEIKLTTTTNMPFAIESAGGDKFENEVEQEAEKEEPSFETTEQALLPSLGGVSLDTENDIEKDEDQEQVILVPLIIGLFVVLIAIVPIIIIARLRKKKKAKAPSGNMSIQNVMPQFPEDSGSQEDDDRTQFIVERDIDDSEMTRMLLGQVNQSVWLVLKSVDRPSTEFRVPIQDVVIIGRKNADIAIDYDQHISSKHCEIIKRGELLYIRDLGSLNGTFYENIQVLDQEIPIVDGGTIRVGNSKFTVMIVRQ